MTDISISSGLPQVQTFEHRLAREGVMALLLGALLPFAALWAVVVGARLVGARHWTGWPLAVLGVALCAARLAVSV